MSPDGGDEHSPVPHIVFWHYDAADKVVLGGKALFLGAFVSCIVFCTLLSIPTAISSGTVAWVGAIFLFAAIPALVVGVVVGAMLDVCLRRLQNQWLHVAAFFAAGALICVPFGGFSSWGASLFPVSMALAAGIGRLSVWRLVKINPNPSLT